MPLPTRSQPLLNLLSLVCFLRTSPAFGQPVGPELQVNTYTTQGQQQARVATDSSGNFVVVWQSNTQDGWGYGVFGQRFGSTGASLGTEFRVNSYTTNHQYGASVAADPAGNFIVVWMSSSQDGSGAGVFGQRFSSAGATLGAEFKVNTYTTNPQGDPCVAGDSNGNFVVVWRSSYQEGSFSGIFGQRYGSSGVPLGTEFHVNTYTTSFQESPRVASDASGSFVVVWSSTAQDGSADGVFGQRYDSAGSPLGAEFRVNTYTTGPERFASVAIDADGDFVVVWQSSYQEGSADGVFGQRYDSAGAPLGLEFRLNTYTTGLQGFPSVESGSGGEFVVVWQSNAQDGSGDGIFCLRYDSVGAPLGTETLVNTYTSNAQFRPSIATQPNGNFVVAWASSFQDGSDSGVFGKVSCPLLGSVTISVSGPTAICANSTGGTATVRDDDGGTRTHQWGFRTISLGPTTQISGQTGTSYVIDGANFPGAGFYYLVCYTTSECQQPVFSNEIAVIVDITSPAVTPPGGLAMTQTLCM